MISSTMTDRDLAFNLGRHIIKQMQRITALESFITEYYLSVPQCAEVPWREAVKQNQNDETVQKTTSAWLKGLRLAIDAETQDSALIRVLHRQFLKEE
jgi:hypothetical protein